MAKRISAASALAVSSSLAAIISNPKRRLAFPFFPSTAFQLQATLYICRFCFLSVSTTLGLSRTGSVQSDSLFLAECPIRTGLVNLIGKNRSGVAAEFPVIILDYRSQVAAFVEISPARLFQKSEDIYNEKVQLMTEFRWIGCFLPPLNRADMRLLQTNDSVLADVVVVVIYLLLLCISGASIMSLSRFFFCFFSFFSFFLDVFLFFLVFWAGVGSSVLVSGGLG